MPETLELETVATGGNGTPTRRGTVYIVQSTPGQLSRYRAAKRYGDLKVIMERDSFADNAEEHVLNMRSRMKNVLAAFNPAKDFILLTGDPLAIAMCVLTLSYMTLSIPFLKWDRDEQNYYPVVVSV